jgi:hypothetical protein
MRVLESTVNTMGYDYGTCFYREELKMACARQKLILQKLQTEDEERRSVRTPQQQQQTTSGGGGQRLNFSSSYQSEFINHTQSATEVRWIC